MNFNVDNADFVFAANNRANTALPGLGGVALTANGIGPSFDWGLPFFFGRPVYVLFEQHTIGSVAGPATGF